MDDRPIGLVVNPVAGIGGPAGLKGSDGADIQALATSRGARSQALVRARETLMVLPAGMRVLTVAGDMGADAVLGAGHLADIVAEPVVPSTGADTQAAMRALVRAGAGLILFAGGDGTARDVLAGLGSPPDVGVAVLGIPAGVKMYSSVFAISPVAAGRTAADWAAGRAVPVAPREVLDVSEEQVRAGVVEATLFGFAPVPVAGGRTQARKTAGGASDREQVVLLGRAVAGTLDPAFDYILGPGSTTSAIAAALGVTKTPLGVDVVSAGRLVLADAAEGDLLAHTATRDCRAIVTIIGGQGFVLGRGNQQLSAAVLRRLRPPMPMVVATAAKLAATPRPLLLDTGDLELDRSLSGYVRVITGAQDVAIVPVRAAADYDRQGES